MMQTNRVEIAGFLAAKPELSSLRDEGGECAPRRDLSLRRSWWKTPIVHELAQFYNEVADVAVTYEQGENIYVVGSIQQRKYTPADGSQRTVHEIHVRSCHLIGSPRLRRDKQPADAATLPEESTLGEQQNDDGWPVSAS